MKTDVLVSTVKLLLISISLSACTTTTLGKPIGYTAKRKAGFDRNAALVEATEPDEGTERKRVIGEIHARRDEITAAMQTRASALETEARHDSLWYLALTGVGMGSSIAAGALAVASPANAVTVAVFSGVSSGVIGYQSSLASQGLSRDAAIRVYDAFRKSYSDLAKSYEDAAVGLQIDKSQADWETAVSGAMTAIRNMETLVIMPGIPSVSDDKTKELETKIQDAIDKLNQLQKQLPQQSPPPPHPNG